MRKSRKRFLEDDDDGHMSESWLLPYSDLLTLLLALFIVLFASSNINQTKYKALMESFKSEFTGTKINSENAGLSLISSPEKKVTKQKETAAKQPVQSPPAEQAADPDLDQLMQKLQAYIKDNHLEAFTTLQETKRGVEIAFKDVILYDPGKADLKKSSYKTLDQLVGLIKTVGNPVSIEGHTDNVPIKNSQFKSNWELSSARAASVLHYFESKKIADNRLQFTGYGEYKPLYPNDTSAHRQANRRVNIVILRED